ncbi:MAG: hypothetical protein M3Y09_20615, partial [Actinomycetota bacterium]|nr:hypothetical protein [Actinomycetota bacterium]
MSSRDVADAPRRRWAVRALVGMAVLLAVLALTLSYLGRAVLRPGPFVDRAVATLRDPAVRDDVADRLTDAITQSGGGDLLSVRPVVRSVAGAVVGSRAFAALFRSAILHVHGEVVERPGDKVVIRLADVGVLFEGVLQRFAPDAARAIGAERVSRLQAFRPGSGLLDVVRIARRVYSAAWVLGALALIAAAGALLISPRRRRTAQRFGFGLVLGGLAVVV